MPSKEEFMKSYCKATSGQLLLPKQSHDVAPAASPDTPKVGL